jgi:hypothetical protein
MTISNLSRIGSHLAFRFTNLFGSQMVYIPIQLLTIQVHENYIELSDASIYWKSAALPKTEKVAMVHEILTLIEPEKMR